MIQVVSGKLSRLAAQPWAAVALVMTALLAALAPMLDRGLHRHDASDEAFPGWPRQFEGRTLRQLALTGREAGFVAGFPGRVGRFHDGRREIIIRWVNKPTRLLHPAADCFKGIGYAITPLPARRSRDGHLMSCFRAVRGKDALTVCELIRGAQGEGASESWPDVSAWYWSALLGTSSAPWWSYVVAEVSDG
jgi:hypothetical protein